MLQDRIPHRKLLFVSFTLSVCHDPLLYQLLQRHDNKKHYSGNDKFNTPERVGQHATKSIRGIRGVYDSTRTFEAAQSSASTHHSPQVVGVIVRVKPVVPAKERYTGDTDTKHKQNCHDRLYHGPENLTENTKYSKPQDIYIYIIHTNPPVCVESTSCTTRDRRPRRLHESMRPCHLLSFQPNAQGVTVDKYWKENANPTDGNLRARARANKTFQTQKQDPPAVAHDVVLPESVGVPVRVPEPKVTRSLLFFYFSTRTAVRVNKRQQHFRWVHNKREMV